MKRAYLCKVQGTSVAGAVAHNIGQVIAAWFVVRTPMLMNSYLPALIGVGIIGGMPDRYCDGPGAYSAEA